MSNFLVNPIVVDGVMAAGYKALTSATLGTPRTLLVEKIYWEDAASIGDQLTIVDPVSGTVLASAKAAAAGASYWIDFVAKPKLWQDFQVTVLASGTLYVFTG